VFRRCPAYNAGPPAPPLDRAPSADVTINIVRRSRASPAGLRLGDPYRPELTSVRAEVRGSDFGDASCGGRTDFFDAVLRAPAFRDPEIVAGEAGKARVGRRRYRPAIEVPPVAW
jgi:hypothetical protein